MCCCCYIPKEIRTTHYFYILLLFLPCLPILSLESPSVLIKTKPYQRTHWLIVFILGDIFIIILFLVCHSYMFTYFWVFGCLAEYINTNNSDHGRKKTAGGERRNTFQFYETYLIHYSLLVYSTQSSFLEYAKHKITNSLKIFYFC